MPNKKRRLKKKSDRGFYEPYANFSRTLRAWLVAYGIGAPVLFSTQTAFSGLLQKKDLALPIVWLYLAGVVVQVLAALIYKYSMGYIYFGELDAKFRKTRRHRVAEWFSEAMWLEMVFDVVSIGALVAATYLVLQHYLTHG